MRLINNVMTRLGKFNETTVWLNKKNKKFPISDNLFYAQDLGFAFSTQ